MQQSNEHIFVSTNPEGYVRNMVTFGLVAEEIFEIVTLGRVLGQISNTDIDLFYSQKLHVLIKTTLITIFMPKSSNFL